jgi:hypothetical protein
MEQSSLETLIVTQLIPTCPAFYGTHIFIFKKPRKAVKKME